MQRCYLCGAEIKEGMSFCPACGAHVYKQDTSEWYSPGCPVEIIEQRLIIDGNKQPYVQILFRNIGSQTVEGVTIAIQCLGLNQDVLAGVKTYTYADLCAQRGQTFGHDVSISLPDAQTRACRVHLERITFSDGSTYTPCAPLHLVEHPSYLAFSDGTLPPDFPKDMRDTSFVQDADGWFCICGCQNLPQETTCWNCGHGIEQVKIVPSLYQKAEKMVVADAQKSAWIELMYEAEKAGAKALQGYAVQMVAAFSEQERQKQKEQADAQARKNRKKNIRIALICLVALFVAGVIVYFVSLELRYRNAKTQMQRGDYLAASETFEKLGNYRDSITQVKEALYRKAVDDAAQGNFEEAIEEFTNLGSYSDSATRLQNVTLERDYQAACAALDTDMPLEDVAAMFEKLGNYKDSMTYLNNIRQWMNEYNYVQAITEYDAGNYWSAYAELLVNVDKNYKDTEQYMKNASEHLQEMAGIYVNYAELLDFGTASDRNVEASHPLSVVAISEDGMHMYQDTMYGDDIQWNADGTINGSAVRQYMNEHRYICSPNVNTFTYEADGYIYLNTAYGHQGSTMDNLFVKVNGSGIEFKEGECDCVLCETRSSAG